MDRAADIAALNENKERKDRKEQERKTESLTYMGVWDRQRIFIRRRHHVTMPNKPSIPKLSYV